MLSQVFATVLDSAAAVALPTLLLSLTASAVVVMTGWRRRRDQLQRQGRPSPVADRVELGRDAFAAGVLDVSSETTAVMQRLDSFAAQRSVALELAVQPNLAVRTDARALREILGDLVAHAIEQSPCGRVLLAAGHVGGRVQITVSDDGAHPDRALLASELRRAERLAALQGATMEIDARPRQGTTIVLRLPVGAGSRRAEIGTEAAAPDPASIWAPQQRAREGSGVDR
jgi:anti-sigma regulatory factor (Ser/Thr protein kinase)